MKIEEIEKKIKNKLMEDGTVDAYVFYSDDVYYLKMSENDISRLNRLMWLIRMLPYKKTVRDCDDYAKAAKATQCLFLKGRAFGEIWAKINGGGYHAFNFYISEAGDLKFYEPQTGKTYADDINLSGQILMVM